LIKENYNVAKKKKEKKIILVLVIIKEKKEIKEKYFNLVGDHRPLSFQPPAPSTSLSSCQAGQQKHTRLLVIG